MKTRFKSTLLIAAVMSGVLVNGAILTSCEKKPRTLGEQIDDALDARPHEKLKDAAEDAKDSVKEAKEGIKDAVKK